MKWKMLITMLSKKSRLPDGKHLFLLFWKEKDKEKEKETGESVSMEMYFPKH